ncbi:MspA (plasmid) [Tsukamurella tyrosinosolvens]|uniref:MspA protein n=1 Tax=Tsukamurella tyrosinosolvens TaxID=57704 RepID=A0A1H4MXY3_TSUTY|nr:MspA family porin [Tsukamurella tyrosinosolvens]AUN39264.1 hypothetical protein ASU32_03925 [Tsukamurella tyrosinosolvens]KXO96985.1 hypothetical protein AXK58_06890 [Tsukamurella tyrosinosolvens]MEC4613046.1 MspA family porin [Tsukamurella tyrosinosolvens]RDB47465.1 hypothetical protein DVB87_12990 [Tsukamurella tyrosinosolvens]SEB87931.1 MspA protein [Tsukamurella tyrosinosolvens]
MTTKLIRTAATAVMAGLAISATSQGAAHADTFIPLPNASTTAKMGSATLTISITKQSARLSPGMVALPTTRNAWVSGVVKAEVTGGTGDGGAIAAGYMVGCQIDVGTASVSADTPVDSGTSFDAGATTVKPSVKATTGASIALSAGSVGAQMLTYDRAIWPKPGDEFSSSWQYAASNFKFSGSSGSLTYSDQTIGVDGCAGYAQARFFVKVTASAGNSRRTVVLWSVPFSLG